MTAAAVGTPASWLTTIVLLTQIGGCGPHDCSETKETGLSDETPPVVDEVLPLLRETDHMASTIVAVEGGELASSSDHVFRARNPDLRMKLCPLASGHIEVTHFKSSSGHTVVTFDAQRSWVTKTILSTVRDASGRLDAVEADLRRIREYEGSKLEIFKYRYKGASVIEAVNRAPSYVGRRSVAMLGVSQGFSSNAAGTCRLDRHFATRGTYVQQISVAYGVTPPDEACQAAREVADCVTVGSQGDVD